MRTAVRRSPVVTFGLLLATLWILLIWIWLFGVVDLSNVGYVGEGALGGVLGLVVMAIALGLLVMLFGELTSSEPRPEPWPPE